MEEGLTQCEISHTLVSCTTSFISNPSFKKKENTRLSPLRENEAKKKNINTTILQLSVFSLYRINAIGFLPE